MHQGGTLVILPSSGIGDVVWRLPYIRAIARQEGPITLLTYPRTKATEWLIYDPSVKNVIYIDQKKLSRTFWNILKGKFSKSWILHKSFSYAFLAFLARIPERIGLGFSKQRFVLTTKNLPPASMRRQHVLQHLNTLIELQGLSLTREDFYPSLSEKALQDVHAEFSSFPRPWICLGIGASEFYKKWPIDHFIELGARISTHHQGTVFLCGGPAETAEVLEIQRGIHQKGGKAETVTHLPIEQTFAFFSQINFYIGNDTGILNIAASFGKPTIGLFGATPSLTYSKSIYPLECPQKDLQGLEAMKAIKPDLVYQVFEHQKPTET